jgi:hypothetical protein
MQLVPDIEYRVNQLDNMNSGHESGDESDQEMNDSEDRAEGAGTNNDEPLVAKFMQLIEANDWQFFEKNRPDTVAHVSDIPVEILLYIFR